MIYACEQKRPEVIKQREEWVQFVESVNPEKLVFLDESGVNTDFTRNYGRSIGKSRVTDHIPRNTPKSLFNPFKWRTRTSNNRRRDEHRKI